MIPGLVLMALAGVADVPAVRCSTLSASEKHPVLGVLSIPQHATLQLGVTQLRAALAGAVASTPDLYLVPTDPALDRCEGSLSCIIEGLDRRAAGEQPRLLLVISSRPGTSGKDRVLATAVNLERALEVVAGLRATDRDELDGALLEAAVLLRPEPHPVVEERDAVEYFDATLRGVSDFLRGEAKTSLSSIALEGAPDGAEVQVDGRGVGVAAGPCTEIVDLHSGTRQVALTKSGYVRRETTAELVAGERLVVRATMLVENPGLLSRVQLSTAWAAGSMSVVGTGLVIYGIADATGYVNSCLGPPCASLGLPRLFHGGEGLVARGKGPLAIPLGYSLLGAGIAMVVTDLFFEADEERPWWLSPLVGLGTGGLLYGLSEATLAPPAH